MEGQKIIYNPAKKERMDIICFGSGSGTTIESILEEQKKMSCIGEPLYKVRGILVNKECRCAEIAKENDIPLIYNDKKKFFRERNASFKDQETLEEYDRKNLKDIQKLEKEKGFKTDLIALAGYWSIVSKPILKQFEDRIINSHPADLSILQNGERKYKGIYGSDAIYRAMVDNESYTKTCIHLVIEEVDAGEIIVSSRPLHFFEVVEKVKQLSFKEDKTKEKVLRALAKYHQELQKRICDYPSYLAALKLIAEGRISIDTEEEKGERTVFLDRKQLPYGGFQL